MKTVYIFCLSFIFLSCYSQSNEALLNMKSYPKGTNTVSILTTDTIDLAYKKIANLILDYGFTIAQSDKELYYINTHYKSVLNNSFDTKIFVRLKENRGKGTIIILKGETTNSGFIFPAENYHRKDVPNRGFAHLLSIASKYENSEILVTKEN